MNENNRGAAWVKVDLHLHSPGVNSFKLSKIMSKG
jgi:hypothetical protein